MSTVGVRYDLYPKDPTRVKTTEFFGSVRHVELLQEKIELPDGWKDLVVEKPEQKVQKTTELYRLVDPLPF